MSKQSELEATLAFQMKAVKLFPVSEFRFHPVRKWRSDFAFPERRILIECEGGTWGKKKSRHTTGSGFEKDCEKYNAAAVLGWLVLRFTSRMIKSGEALKQIEDAIWGQPNDER